MKTNHYCRLVAFFLLALCAVRTANADPAGGQVVAGQATISSPASGVVNINQTSSRAIINWNSFSIAPGEVTTFIQPSANAAALNRVISDNPSLIYGSLQANGHVYLINQSGILVGPGGSVNTGSFTASTLDVSDKSFLSGGNLNFSGKSTAGVDNQGSIRALGGDVFLIANTVANSGSISAPKGTVGLAAGSSVQLLMSGQDKISVLAGNSSAPQAGVGINNLGAIESATAELKAAGGNIYALAINNGGVVRATSLVNENGNIMLKSDGGNIANSGTLSANNANGSGGSVTLDGGHNAANPSTVVNTGVITARGDAPGATGGTVEMLGDHVGIFDQGLVDVSGDAGGGAAMIGGSFQGKDASVQNADMTIVDSGAAIKADALTTGNGGHVVVWSDESTRFYGLISAQGGSLSGNGGNVEVSSHGNLDFEGNVTTLAANGKPGTLLLDPQDITITNGGNSGGTNGAGGFNDGGATVNSVINDGKLNNLLNSGDVTLFANDDIIFANNTSVTAAASSLTLFAGRSITLAGGGTGATINLGTGSFTAKFNDEDANSAGRLPNAANFTMGQNSSITASGGISIQGGTLAADNTGSPTVTLAGNTGNVTITTLITTPVGAGTAGPITVLNNASGAPGKNITVTNSGGTDALSSAGPNTATPNGGAIIMNADGVINISGAVHSDGGSPGGGNPGGNGGNISLTAGGGIVLNNHKVTALGGAGTPNGAGGAITFTATSGGVTNSGVNGFVSGDSLTLSGAGTFTLGGSANNVNTLSGALTGPLTYQNQNALTVNSLSAGSSAINITTITGDLTVAGAVTTTGNATLTATAGNIAQSGAGKVSGNLVTLNADGANGSVTANTAATSLALAGAGTGTITVTEDDGAIVNSATTGSGAINITSTTGDLTVAGAVTTTGNATLTATAGNIAQSGAGKVSGNLVTLNADGANGAVTADTKATSLTLAGAGTGGITVTEDDGATINSATTGSGTVNITSATGDLTVAGAVTTTGNATLTATAGNIAQSGAGKVSGNLVTLNADGANSSVNADTKAASLALLGHGTGGITVTEDDGAIVNSATTGSGAINITSTTGDLTVAGAVTTTGNATLTATAGNIAQSGTGKVSGNLVTLNADGANGSVTADTKATSLTLAGAGTGGITVTEDDGATINSATTGSGTVNITSATGDLTVAGAVTTTGNATLTATAGNIAQSGAGKVSGNLVTLNANGANGAVTADTKAASLALLGHGTGGITVTEDDGATINSAGTGSGAINISSTTGDLTVGGAVTTTGNATLTATAGNIGQSGTGKVSGNLVTLNADGANGAVTADTAATSLAVAGQGTGAVNVTEDDSVTVNSATTGSGAINIASATGNLTVGTVTTSGNIQLLASSGSVLDDNNASTSIQSTAGTTSVTASGAGHNIGSAADPLDISSTGGAVLLDAQGGAVNVNVESAGDAEFTSSADNTTFITTSFAQGGNTFTAKYTDLAGGNFTLLNNGNILDSAGVNVLAPLSTLTLQSTANPGGLGALGLPVLTTAATLNLTGAGAGAINVTESDGATINSANTGSGDINIVSATGDLTVGGPVTTTGNDTLTATAGNILQSGTGKVSGNLVTLNADGANGSVTADTAATSLALAGTGTGTITVAEDDGAAINSAAAGSGNINITSTTGDLTVAGPIATTGHATWTATAGNIAQSGAGKVSGNLVTLNADGGNGSVTADTAATSLTLLGHGTGGITVTEDNGATINSAGTGSGAINITSATGDLIVAGSVATTGNATLTANAGNIAQSGTGKVSGDLVTLNADGVNGSVTADTAATSLALVGAGTGAINVTEDDSVTVNSASTGSGTINITSTTGTLTVGGAVTTTGDAALQAGGANQQLTVNGTGSVSGLTGVQLTADQITLQGPVSSGGARTILQSLTAARDIDLGTKTAGTLGLTDADLDEVTAGVLQVGNATAGAITISAPISPANAPVLALINNASVTESAGGTITEASLRISSPGPVTLDKANQVTNLAGAVSGPGLGFTFDNAGALTVGTVDTVAGITTDNGPISVATANGALAVNNNVDAGTSVANSTVKLVAGSSGNDNLLSIGPGATVQGLAGVTLVGDNISIDTSATPATVTAGTGRVILKQFEDGTAINLGGPDGVGTLGITEAELTRVVTPGNTPGVVVQIGDLNSGDITVTGPISIDPGGLNPNPGSTSITAPRLNLVSGGHINETSGSITVPVLSLEAGDTISLTTPINNVNYLGSQSPLAKTPIHFVDIDTLLAAPGILDGQTSPGITPQPADVQGGGGGINVSTISVQLAGIAYVDIPVVKLSAANFTARVEGNPATILPPGSIATLGLTVPFPDEEDQQAPRRIEDRTKWVSGNMVVSGSTSAPQSPK